MMKKTYLILLCLALVISAVGIAAVGGREPKTNREMIIMPTENALNNTPATGEQTEYITVSFAQKAGNITVDQDNRIITIPVRADISYAGQRPEFGLPDGCSAVLTDRAGQDLDAMMIYDISDGTFTESWTVTTREVYKDVTAAYVLTTAPIFGDEAILQRGADVRIWGTCEGADVVTLEFAGQKRRAPVINNKWEVTLSPMEASAAARPLTVNAGGTELEYPHVYVGDVWLCSGQSNMDMAVRYLSGDAYTQYMSVAQGRRIRFFRVNRSDSTVPLDDFTKECAWSIPSATAVKEYSAYAYAFAVNLEDALDIPVGIIDSAYGGTNIQEWMTPAALNKAGTSYSVSMYNSMIHPMIGLTIKGILWYQGESNVNDRTSYADLFREYAAMYRELFRDPDLPIITTQLPKFLAADYPTWPQFRLTQWEIAQQLDNVHIVCGIDLGESGNIHPLDKFTFGTRAAYLAMNKVYGMDTPAESPYPQSITCSGDTLTVRFMNIEGGLTTVGGQSIRGMTVTDAGGNTVQVSAVITAPDTLTVNLTGITDARSLQYCMTAVPDGNLYDADGLPAAPFSLDIP